jgi:MFS family permease
LNDAGGDAGRVVSVARLRGTVATALPRLRPKTFHVPSLDALNFLAADVRGALGPYVTVFLATDRHWDLAAVGLVTSLGGWIGLLAQTPLGALLDATRRKRGLLAAALFVLGAGALVIALWPSFWPVLAANALMQVVSGIFQPAVAALTVGLFARRELTRRMGRNAAFSRAGNLGIAALAALLAWRLAPRDVFLVVPLLSLGGMAAALSIPHGAIDLRRARGLHPAGQEEDGGPAVWWHTLFRSRAMVVFAATSLLIEFASAPLLTLVGQRLGAAHPGLGVVMTSGCVMVQQAGMLAAALAVGRRGDRWGHRRLLLAGFALVVVQGVLTTFGNRTAWLIGLQALGGVGAGLFNALTPRVLSDVTAGSGHYNLAQGIAATLRALGVTSSGLAAELAVRRFGYSLTFAGCAGVAAVALALFWLAMPRTQQAAP